MSRQDPMEQWLPNDLEKQRLLQAAVVIVEEGLRKGLSAFSPGRAIWSADVIDRLHTRWAEAEKIEGKGFIENLEVQLVNADDDEILLMAEVIALQILPIYGVGHARKLENVRSILRLMEHPVEVPRVFDEAFEGGAFNPGVGMLSHVNRAITIILDLLQRWVRLSEEARQEALASPLGWRALVLEDGSGFPTQRYSLLYLVHPGFFGPIVSADHRQRIREAFIGEIGGVQSPDADDDLMRIVLALQHKAGGPIDFYVSPYVERWADDERPVIEPDPAPIDPRGFDIDEVDTAALAAELHFDEAWVQRVVRALHRRGQIILYGPPGTGKTYFARALTRVISGSESAVKRVQFHPSYSYEDFFAGYRPLTNADGQLSFELSKGPLREIADEARRNPELVHVLMIDEINRANLSKVFGELYYLLEYRDDPIDVLYAGSGDGGGRTFRLPSNVVIIGTMNTADRSIALLDSAMRRRFAFFELHPDASPVHGVLHRWAAAHGQSPLAARVFDALNADIESRDDRIGPSYLMHPGGSSRELLDAVWEESLIPLLEERYLGTGIDVRRRFALETLIDRAEFPTR